MSNWVAAAAASALLIASAGDACARPFEAKDLAMLDRVSDPRVSPDGQWIAVNWRSTDWDANKGANALRLVRANGTGEPLIVAPGEKASTSPRWDADGRLYFLSGKSGSQQVWRREVNGQLAQVTAFPIDVAGFRLAPDGTSMVTMMDVRPDCATLACTKTYDEAHTKEKASGQFIADGVRSRAWDAYEDGMYVSLFAVDLRRVGAPSEAVPLLPHWSADVIDKVEGDDSAISVSRDGKTVYFSARDPKLLIRDDSPSALWSVPSDGSAPAKRLEPADTRWIAQPTLSPDGRMLAYLTRTTVDTYSRTGLDIRDLRNGKSRTIDASGDRSLRRIIWSPDGKTIYAAADQTGQGPLVAFDLAKNAVETIVGEGSVTDFDVRSGTTAWVAASLTSPGQLYVRAAGTNTRALTTIGRTVFDEAPLAPAEQFSFPGWNDEVVHGYVVKPQHFVPGNKYPVAFLIHGGPHGSFGNAWSYRWNPQVWASMGYAVVMIDFHGSSGYGEDFGRAIVGHWGDRPLEDLKKGWASALQRYDWLDSSRACALGGSYGGYMVNWIGGHWSEPWKCLVDHAGVFDTRVMAWSTDIQGFSEAQFRGLSRTTDDAIDRFDPSDAAATWKVPTLVIHGAKDFRVPLDQGISTHNALRRAGVPTEMLVFPDENHWVLKPQNSVQWYSVVKAWMDRWTNSSLGEPASAHK